MFEASGRNRLGHRLGKPAMHDPADAEWGILSPRPITRWTKRQPTKRTVFVLVCLFTAAVYGVRMWNERLHLEQQRAQKQIYSPGLKPAKDVGRQAPSKPRPQEKVEVPPAEEDDGKPPLFGRFHQAELALPQHHVADPFAGGKKYLWVENHVHGAPLLVLVLSQWYSQQSAQDLAGVITCKTCYLTRSLPTAPGERMYSPYPLPCVTYRLNT